jgi:hypothetical protein
MVMGNVSKAIQLRTRMKIGKMIRRRNALDITGQRRCDATKGALPQRCYDDKDGCSQRQKMCRACHGGRSLSCNHTLWGLRQHYWWKETEELP